MMGPLEACAAPCIHVYPGKVGMLRALDGRLRGVFSSIKPGFRGLKTRNIPGDFSCRATRASVPLPAQLGSTVLLPAPPAHVRRLCRSYALVGGTLWRVTPPRWQRRGAARRARCSPARWTEVVRKRRRASVWGCTPHLRLLASVRRRPRSCGGMTEAAAAGARA